MKKLISTILVLAFVLAALSAIAPSISAKSATISEREAKELVEKAGQLFRARVGGYNNKYFDTISDERKTVHFPEYNIDVTYCPVLESALPGGSYAAVCKLANEIYTEDIASKAYNVARYSMRDENGWYTVDIPNFYVDESGKVFACGFLEYGRIYLDSDNPYLISNLRGNSSEARAVIAVGYNSGDGPRIGFYFPVECKFVKTTGGWRIAESELSILFATDISYLEDYRKINPDKASPEAEMLIDAEANGMIDEIMEFVSFIYNYDQTYREYAKKNGEEYVTLFKEKLGDNGEKKNMRYYLLKRLGLVTGYGESEEEISCYLTESAYKKLDRAYADNDFERKITEGEEEYVAVPEKVNFVYDPETAVVKVIESTDKTATALVYCELIKDGKRIPISVECKFEKFYSQWDVADSPFVDMITSAEEFEYTIAEAPKTGDAAYNTIALCLGGIAIIMSAICLVCRKREIL